MDRRTAVLGAAAALAGLLPPRSPARAEEPLKLRWADLVPPPEVVTGRPSRPTVAEGEVDLAEFATRDGPLEDPHGSAPEPEGRWMSRPRPTRRPPAAVVASLDGRRVVIGGYVVPLDLDARSIREMLLVPFVGACIHVPPPPSNQVIHVAAERPFQIRDLFDPVWVTGRIRVVHSRTDLADAGYSIAAERVEAR